MSEKTVEELAFEYARSNEIIGNIFITDGLEVAKEEAFKAGYGVGRKHCDHYVQALWKEQNEMEEMMGKIEALLIKCNENCIDYSCGSTSREAITALAEFRGAK